MDRNVYDPFNWSVVTVKSTEGVIYEGILKPSELDGREVWNNSDHIELIDVEILWPVSEIDSIDQLRLPIEDVFQIRAFVPNSKCIMNRNNRDIIIPPSSSSSSPQPTNGNDKNERLFKPNATTLDEALAKYGHITLDSVKSKNGDKIMEEILKEKNMNFKRNIVDNYSIPIDRDTKDYKNHVKFESQFILNQILTKKRKFDFTELPEELQFRYIQETEGEGKYKTEFLIGVTFNGAKFVQESNSTYSQYYSYNKKKKNVIDSWKIRHKDYDYDKLIGNNSELMKEPSQNDEIKDDCIADDLQDEFFIEDNKIGKEAEVLKEIDPLAPMIEKNGDTSQDNITDPSNSGDCPFQKQSAGDNNNTPTQTTCIDKGQEQQLPSVSSISINTNPNPNIHTQKYNNDFFKTSSGDNPESPKQLPDPPNTISDRVKKFFKMKRIEDAVKKVMEKDKRLK